MKRVVFGVALIAVIAISIDELGDRTQSRPDQIDEGAVTEVVVAVREDRFGPGRDAAADALWAVCAAQTRSRVIGADSPEPVGEGRYRVLLKPAVGPHDEVKLVGCLEDLTVDRVLADVESLRTYNVTSVAALESTSATTSPGNRG